MASRTSWDPLVKSEVHLSVYSYYKYVAFLTSLSLYILSWYTCSALWISLGIFSYYSYSLRSNPYFLYISSLFFLKFSVIYTYYIYLACSLLKTSLASLICFFIYSSFVVHAFLLIDKVFLVSSRTETILVFT